MIQEMSADQVSYIFRNMEDAVCLTSRKGDLLYANPAAEKLFGLDRTADAKIWDVIPFVAGNDELIQLFIDGVMEKKSLQSLVDYYRKDGSKARLRVSLTYGSDGLILFVISDLTNLLKLKFAFARYTSPEIADIVMTTPDGEKQGGQTREVTILMSDLRGFTAMSTHLSSTELIDLINHYFEFMSEAISRNKGTVIEFLGDGIFSVFGAPIDLPDHPAAAVRCAVEMQNAMEKVNAWNREKGYPEMEMGIGIHTGLAVVGNIGSEHKMKYGCMGETVNLAGRLESLSTGGQIYISEKTLKMIPEGVTVAGENSFMPKGGRDELKVFEITGIGKDLHLNSLSNKIEWEELPSRGVYPFHLLNGKVVGEETYHGELFRMSADGKYAWMKTDRHLFRLDNLMIRIADADVYAKVTAVEADGYTIRFTSKPDHLKELMEKN